MTERIQEVAELFKVDPAMLCGHSRVKHLIPARQALCWTLKQDGYSLDAIGLIIGGRDHTTILYSVEQAELRAREDARYAERLKQLCDTPIETGGKRYEGWKGLAQETIAAAEKIKQENTQLRAGIARALTLLPARGEDAKELLTRLITGRAGGEG